MNANYHKCLSVCKHIQQRMGTAIQTALTPQLLVATADKLIYNHAIEMVSFYVVQCISYFSIKKIFFVRKLFKFKNVFKKIIQI